MHGIKVYTPDEARRMLRIGRSRIYALLRAGKLKSVRNGRRFLIPEDCLERYKKESVHGKEGDSDA